MSNTNYVKIKKNTWFKKIVMFILSIILIISLLGIENAYKTDHSMFVVAIGIDKSPTDEDKILVTFQIVPPQVTSQSSTDIDKVIVTSVNEDSLEKAVSMVHNYMSSIINFSHTRAIVFSEDIAKEGVLKYLNSISSNRMYDTNMFVMVSKCSAEEYLSSLSKDTEVNPILYYNILRNAEKISSSIDTITVMEFLKQLEDPYVQPTAPLCDINENGNSKESTKNTENGNNSNSKSPDNKQQSTNEPSNPAEQEEENNQSSSSGSSKSESSSKSDEVDNTKNSNSDNILQKSKNKIEVGGTAVFKDDKMVGSLNRDETAYHIMISSTLFNYYTDVTYSDNNKKVKSNLYVWQQEKTKVEVDVKSDVPVINIYIPLNINILDTTDKSYDFYNQEYMSKMKGRIIDKLEDDANDYIKKMQQEYKIDIDDYVKYIKKEFLTMKDMDDYDWNDKYVKAHIKVNFDIRFVTSGLSVKK